MFKVFTADSFENLTYEQLKVLSEIIQYAYAQATESRISILVDDANDDEQQETQCKLFIEALEAIYNAEWKMQ